VISHAAVKLDVDKTVFLKLTATTITASDDPCMKYLNKKAAQSGKLGWIFLWLIGVPVPLLLLLFLLRGCT